jgi:hypothetical protein
MIDRKKSYGTFQMNNGRGVNNRRHLPKWLILLLSILLLVIITVIFLGIGYVRDYYHADPAVFGYLENGAALPEDVEVSSLAEHGITEAEGLYFDGPGDQDALVFYPGAKVEYTAYAPLLSQIAEEGLDCFLIKMPLNLAFTGREAAAYVMNSEEFMDRYEGWYVGGHSLGGAMAGDWAGANLQDESLKGVIFLAAYPTRDLARDNFRVLTIYGDSDGVLQVDKVESGQQYLPEDHKTIVIEGGNHAQFADYGRQQGDGEATIPRQEQQAQTAEDILEYVYPAGREDE